LRCQENLTTEKDMANANDRYEDCAEDRVEVIKARIRGLKELLEQLKSKAPTSKETIH